MYRLHKTTANSCTFFLEELHLLHTNAQFFPNINAILSLFFRFTHQCTFCHITAKLAKAENRQRNCKSKIFACLYICQFV